MAKENEYSVYDVANWFLSKESMTPKKVQKLCYYAYSWVLTLLNDSSDNLKNKLFEENIEAWVHGPVIPELYREYADYGYMPIEKVDEAPKFSDDVKDVLEQVWSIYGGYNANELESITHQETPWSNARKGYSPVQKCNEIISDKEIFEYYIQNAS